MIRLTWSPRAAHLELAMTTCASCGHENSGRAVSCSECSRPLDSARRGAGWSRRAVLRLTSKLGGGLLIAPAVVDLGCGSDSSSEVVGSVEHDDVVLGLFSANADVSLEESVRRVLRMTDLSWLSPGDTVLLKPAFNSGNPHPATTSLTAIRAVIAELYASGAGRVILAEQSGVEFVRNAQGGARYSSTRKLLAPTGLSRVVEESGGETLFFDELDYERDYFEASPPAGSPWLRPPRLPRVIADVDHILYLPRLSSHAFAGCTHGHKLAIGFLRDDSRHDLHHDAGQFYEKYTDISYIPEIRDRFRGSVTLAEKLLLHAGPDIGTEHAVDPAIVIASRSLSSHDVLADSIFLHINRTTPPSSELPFRYDRALASTLNRLFTERVVERSTGIAWRSGSSGAYAGFSAHMFEDGISENRVLERAWQIEGARPRHIRVHNPGQGVVEALRTSVEEYGEGLLRFA